MNEHRHQTPVLSKHARERCAEMEISTKVAKRIWQNQTLTWKGAGVSGCLIVNSDLYPAYQIVVSEKGDGTILIVTVLYRTYEPFERKKA